MSQFIKKVTLLSFVATISWAISPAYGSGWLTCTHKTDHEQWDRVTWNGCETETEFFGCDRVPYETSSKTKIALTNPQGFVWLNGESLDNDRIFVLRDNGNPLWKVSLKDAKGYCTKLAEICAASKYFFVSVSGSQADYDPVKSQLRYKIRIMLNDGIPQPPFYECSHYLDKLN